MLAPKAFTGVTVMGADVQHSMLWHWLQRKGVLWVEDKDITGRLQYREYPEKMQRRLHIRHGFNDEDTRCGRSTSATSWLSRASP